MALATLTVAIHTLVVVGARLAPRHTATFCHTITGLPSGALRGAAARVAVRVAASPLPIQTNVAVGVTVVLALALHVRAAHVRVGRPRAHLIPVHVFNHHVLRVVHIYDLLTNIHVVAFTLAPLLLHVVRAKHVQQVSARTIRVPANGGLGGRVLARQ